MYPRKSFDSPSPMNGNVMLVKLVQPMKAESPMLVTESGIVMLVSPIQPEKAKSQMLVIVTGMAIEPFAEGYAIRIEPSLFISIPASELKTVLPDETMISVSPVQREKAFSPILVTESGIVMLVSSLQPEKAFSSMLVAVVIMTSLSEEGT